MVAPFIGALSQLSIHLRPIWIHLADQFYGLHQECPWCFPLPNGDHRDEPHADACGDHWGQTTWERLAHRWNPTFCASRRPGHTAFSGENPQEMGAICWFFFQPALVRSFQGKYASFVTKVHPKRRRARHHVGLFEGTPGHTLHPHRLARGQDSPGAQLRPHQHFSGTAWLEGGDRRWEGGTRASLSNPCRLL